MGGNFPGGKACRISSWTRVRYDKMAAIVLLAFAVSHNQLQVITAIGDVKIYDQVLVLCSLKVFARILMQCRMSSIVTRHAAYVSLDNRYGILSDVIILIIVHLFNYYLLIGFRRLDMHLHEIWRKIK